MKSKPNAKPMTRLVSQAVALAAVLLIVTAFGWAGENTIFTFNRNNGANPNGTMVMDAAGNLYGVTTTGGLANCFGNTCGVVYKLTPSSSVIGQKPYCTNSRVAATDTSPTF